MKSRPLSNLVVVSDLHAGCQMALCPKRVALDAGGHYEPSAFQRLLQDYWTQFWTKWVPEVTKGEPYALVVNGDALDGVHHGSTTQITHNLKDQARIARDVLRPVIDRAAAYYHIRGTEAHSAQTGAEEERLAAELGAAPDALGNASRWEMWYELVGTDGAPRMVHFTHHIGGGLNSFAALSRELSSNYAETGRWGRRPADVIIRSHRHRYEQIQLCGSRGLQIAAITPGWQGKTPFAYRIDGRLSPPQFGGIVVRAGDGGLYVRAKVWAPGREEERLG